MHSPDAIRYGHGSVFRLLAALPEERIRIVTLESGLWELDEIQ